MTEPTETIEAQLDAAAETIVNRRRFLGKAGLGVAGFAASASIMAACGSSGDSASDDGGDGSGGDGGDDGAADGETVDLVQDSDLPEIEWEMATSWPLSLDTIFGGAVIFADTLSELTAGRFKVNPRAAGELAGGLEVLNAVVSGGADAGHTASYYYVGQNTAMQFGTAVPFGLTSRQQNAWLYEGGGEQLLNDFYAEEFGIISFAAGNTGCQMGGWFGKEINTVADLNGLTMRIPGLAGKVLNNLGGEQISIPGGEIITSIETGAIDAAEFVGPYDDVNLGLDQLGSDVFYYYPGWWEPGSALDVQFPLDKWNDLPTVYQAAVKAAAKAANLGMMARYDNLNPQSLKQIQAAGVTILPFSEEIMDSFQEETESVLDAEAATNPDFASILGPWRQYRDDIQAWHSLAEAEYMVRTSIGR
ncbi:MAG: ABC transporter substrate-binding protein [Acidimicrobiales bacterium]|nr:ABC transporter substrate-binding protein [Acidimicrobiales bacterium]